MNVWLTLKNFPTKITKYCYRPLGWKRGYLLSIPRRVYNLPLWNYIWTSHTMIKKKLISPRFSSSYTLRSLWHCTSHKTHNPTNVKILKATQIQMLKYSKWRCSRTTVPVGSQHDNISFDCMISYSQSELTDTIVTLHQSQQAARIGRRNQVTLT